MNNVHFSSATDQWATPQDLFDVLNQAFGFELDVCADNGNAKCSRFFTAEQNGLAQEWAGRCWMNPPYGREIGKWVQKAYESAQRGAFVACLLPARTDTKWWHDYAIKGDVHFIKGRLKFGDATAGAPFPVGPGALLAQAVGGRHAGQQRPRPLASYPRGRGLERPRELGVGDGV